MRRTPPFISSLGWPPVKGDLPHYVSVTGAEPSSHAFTLHNYSDPVHLSFLTVPHKVTPLYPAVDCRTEIQPDERSPVTPAHLDLDNAPIIRSQVPRRTCIGVVYVSICVCLLAERRGVVLNGWRMCELVLYSG